jgi:glycosyltransferase involved in cell wall biosynthesis
MLPDWNGSIVSAFGGEIASGRFKAWRYDMPSLLSIVIPVFNEEKTLVRVIEKLTSISLDMEILIVDDASTDSTPGLIRMLRQSHPNLRCIRHEKNAGKTAALKTGFAETRGDIVIVQDSDLEYDPADIPFLIGPIVEGKASVAYGSRFLVRRAARVLYFYHYIANRCLTLLSNALTNLNMTDVETGYKAFRGEIIRNMVITSTGFGFEIEVTAKIAKLQCPVYEVPISYYGRTYEEGKKIGTWDGVTALWYIFKYNVLCSKARAFRNLEKVYQEERVAAAAGSR